MLNRRVLICTIARTAAVLSEEIWDNSSSQHVDMSCHMLTGSNYSKVLPRTLLFFPEHEDDSDA